MNRDDLDHAVRAIRIASDVDIVEARTAVRSLASEVGFAGTDLVMIATAVSEIARNIVEYAKRGQVICSVVQTTSHRGLEIVARDEGPGIADVSQAMQDGYSSASGLGLGLPGSRRMMDEFLVDTKPGRGTTITMRKWLP